MTVEGPAELKAGMYEFMRIVEELAKLLGGVYEYKKIAEELAKLLAAVYESRRHAGELATLLAAVYRSKRIGEDQVELRDGVCGVKKDTVFSSSQVGEQSIREENKIMNNLIFINVKL